jgi:hypothetical protein
MYYDWPDHNGVDEPDEYILQLSKEEEGAGDDVEVRREDQDKINKFSRLHQKELKIEDTLKAKNVSIFSSWT